MGLFILIEAASLVFLWALNPVGQADEAVFAIFLAIELVSLAMISYVYRTYKGGGELNRGVILTACCLILIFVYIALAF